MVRQYQIRMEAIAALDMASKSKQYSSLVSVFLIPTRTGGVGEDAC